MNPTAYEMLVELVAIRDLERSKSMTTLEFDEYCARYDAADAPARACVARGDVTVPREPTEAMFEAARLVLPRGDARWLWNLMHDAATKENAK